MASTAFTPRSEPGRLAAFLQAFSPAAAAAAGCVALAVAGCGASAPRTVQRPAVTPARTTATTVGPKAPVRPYVTPVPAVPLPVATPRPTIDPAVEHAQNQQLLDGLDEVQRKANDALEQGGVAPDDSGDGVLSPDDHVPGPDPMQISSQGAEATMCANGNTTAC
jgi:hypothetical protein